MSGGAPLLPDEEDGALGSTALVPLEVGGSVEELDPLVVLIAPVDVTPVDVTPVDVTSPVEEPVPVAKLGGES